MRFFETVVVFAIAEAAVVCIICLVGWSEKDQKIFFILVSNAIVVKICLVTVLIKVYKNFSNISYSSGAPAKLKFSNFC